MIQNFLPQTKINECHFQGLEKDHRLISEEVTGLRSQLERARAEKENVEEALSEAQVMLAQEQREHRSLAQSRAREAELWTDEREKSLSLVEEMTKEVRRRRRKMQLNIQTTMRDPLPTCKCIVAVSFLDKLLIISRLGQNYVRNKGGFKGVKSSLITGRAAKKSKSRIKEEEFWCGKYERGGGVRGSSGQDCGHGDRDQGTQRSEQTLVST